MVSDADQHGVDNVFLTINNLQNTIVNIKKQKSQY